MNNVVNYIKNKQYLRIRYEQYLLFMIVIIGLILRLYNLGDNSLWLDEFFSLRDSKTIYTALNKRGHPPLYYIILHTFRYIGESEFVLRFPSAIFGILTIFVIYKIGSLMFGIKEGLYSAFLLSISPFHIYYSQEARMYSLLTLFSLLSLFFYYKSIHEDNKRLWFWFIVATVLNLYTHNFAVFIIAIEVIYFILKYVRNFISVNTRKNKNIDSLAIKFILSMIIIFLLYLPWSYKTILPLMLYTPRREQFMSKTTWVKQIPALQLLISILSKFSVGNGISLHIFLFFFILGSILNIKKDELFILLLWFSLPIISLLSISTYIRPMIDYSTPRYLLFVLPIFILIVSIGIVSVEKKIYELSIKLFRNFTNIKNIIIRSSLNISIILLFFGISVIPLQGYYNKIYTNIKYQPYYAKQDWKGAIQYIETNLRSGDVIVIEPEWYGAHLSYYFNVNLNVTLFRKLTLERNTTFELHVNLKTNLTKLNLENITFQFIGTKLTMLKDVISKNNRVWIIFIDKNSTKEISNWFYENYGIGKKFAGNIHVYLIQPSLFNAAIIKNEVWDSWIEWHTLLSFLDASSTIFNDTVRIDNIDLSEFNVLVLADFIRPVNDSELLYLEKHIQKGLIVILTGTSPSNLAGDNSNLSRISKWFGATTFKIAPKEERWKVRFENKALDISTDIDLDRDYLFYKRTKNWSSPYGCIIKPESTAYAHISNNEAITIFTHKFENGTSIYIGPKGYAFNSPDADTFKLFTQDLIHFVVMDTS